MPRPILSGTPPSSTLVRRFMSSTVWNVFFAWSPRFLATSSGPEIASSRSMATAMSRSASAGLEAPGYFDSTTSPSARECSQISSPIDSSGKEASGGTTAQGTMLSAIQKRASSAILPTVSISLFSNIFRQMLPTQSSKRRLGLLSPRTTGTTPAPDAVRVWLMPCVGIGG